MVNLIGNIGFDIFELIYLKFKYINSNISNPISNIQILNLFKNIQNPRLGTFFNIFVSTQLLVFIFIFFADRNAVCLAR